MSDSKIKALYEDRANVWEQMKALRDKDELSAEDNTAWDAAEVRLDAIGADIDRREKMAKMEAIATKPIDELTQREMSNKELSQEQKYERAYSNYLVRGASEMTSEDRAVLATGATEIRAQAAGTNSAGGYTVPPGFLVRMTETLKAYGGLVNHAEILNTSTGNPLQWPTNDDTANVGAQVAENAAITNLNDFTFGTKTLGAYMYTSGLVLVSYQLLQDSAFDLNSWLPTRLGIRLGRKMAIDLITGNGTTAPEGIATNITTGVTGAVAGSSFVAGGLASATTGAVTAYTQLIDLQHSVDPAYRANAKWALNDSMLKQIRKVVDGNGRPLWEPYTSNGLVNPGTDAPQAANQLGGGSGGTLLGNPVVVDQGIAVPALSAKSIVYGDLNQALIIRQVAGADTLRLAERYAEFLQIGFFGFMRWDAKANNAGAVRAFVGNAA